MMPLKRANRGVDAAIALTSHVSDSYTRRTNLDQIKSAFIGHQGACCT